MLGYIKGLQEKICSKLESLDKGSFHEDEWEHKEGGGGNSRILENGSIFEKGGVNISAVYGNLSEEIALHLKKKPMKFAACGISLVLHPFSPRIPTVHMNIRYFEMEDHDSWFGGGIDMTPYYPHEDDFFYFHDVLRNAVEAVMPGRYHEYKKNCDEYFTIKHRNEMRGIGGIFFDYLRDDHPTHFQLVQNIGEHFLPGYVPIVTKRKDERFSEADKSFQLIRRGRYVEFNLIYDRGTLFGLKTNGRIESILMSLPMHVAYRYDYQPPKGTPYETMTHYYQPRDWMKKAL